MWMLAIERAASHATLCKIIKFDPPISPNSLTDRHKNVDVGNRACSKSVKKTIHWFPVLPENLIS